MYILTRILDLWVLCISVRDSSRRQNIAALIYGAGLLAVEGKMDEQFLPLG